LVVWVCNSDRQFAKLRNVTKKDVEVPGQKKKGTGSVLGNRKGPH